MLARTRIKFVSVEYVHLYHQSSVFRRIVLHTRWLPTTRISWNSTTQLHNPISLFSCRKVFFASFAHVSPFQAFMTTVKVLGVAMALIFLAQSVDFEELMEQLEEMEREMEERAAESA